MLARFLPSPALVVALAALVVALGGTAFAVTNFVGTNGQIQGCVSKKGKLVLIKPGATCTEGSPLAWNQRGRRGLTGKQGPKGDTGPAAGPAGGDLAGNYPNPTIAPAEQSHLVAPFDGSANCSTTATGKFCGFDANHRWDNYRNGYPAVAFYMDRGGIVHLEGVAHQLSTYNGQTIFYLPAKYQPGSTRVFGVRADESDGPHFAYITVGADGSVTETNVHSGGQLFVTLDGIAFRSEPPAS